MAYILKGDFSILGSKYFINAMLNESIVKQSLVFQLLLLWHKAYQRHNWVISHLDCKAQAFKTQKVAD